MAVVNAYLLRSLSYPSASRLYHLSYAGPGQLVLPAFAVIWLVISLLLSWLSGWPALASTFPGGARPAGTALHGKVLRLGAVRENQVTAIVPTTEGLYLYPNVLFRVGRPPVLVPWAEIWFQF